MFLKHPVCKKKNLQIPKDQLIQALSQSEKTLVKQSDNRLDVFLPLTILVGGPIARQKGISRKKGENTSDN